MNALLRLKQVTRFSFPLSIGGCAVSNYEVLAISAYLESYRRATTVLAPGPAMPGWCQLGKHRSWLFSQLLCQPNQQGQVIRWELGAGH